MDDNLQKAESYSPPQSVRNNAKRGLKLREKYGRGGLSTGEAGKQGIGSGVARARDLASGKGMSLATVKRMHAFFSRHRKNKDSRKPNGEPGAGMIAWLLWGGDSGASWAKGIAQKETKKAEDKPGNERRGSDRNKPGSASSGSGSITVSAATEKALQAKVAAHNEKGKHKVTLGKLKAVYRRGAGAYSSGARANSRNQWAMARVNAFLHLVRTGSPKNSKYVQDNDLLPSSHPRAGKSTKKMECKSADGCKLGDVCKKAGSCQYGQKGYKKDEAEDEINTVSCEVVKMDASRRLVFGFAVVSKIDGEDYYDRHGDHIPEDEVLNASLAFAKSAAPANVNHRGPDVGSHPFVFPLTTEIAKSLGIETSRTGLLIGQQVDPETFAKFESGELRAFSIEGVAVPEEQ